MACIGDRITRRLGQVDSGAAPCAKARIGRNDVRRVRTPDASKPESVLVVPLAAGVFADGLEALHVE